MTVRLGLLFFILFLSFPSLLVQMPCELCPFSSPYLLHALLLQFALFLTFLPADHNTLDDYGTALTHGIPPRILF